MNVELITLDLDNTLWDVDRTIRRAEQNMREWMTSHAPDSLAVYTPEEVLPLRKIVAQRYPDRVHDLSFMRIAVLTEVMRRAGYASKASHLAEQAFQVFFQARNEVIFFPGALETLRVLAEDFELIALTNGNADINAVGIGHHFRTSISSADVGASKPDARMFQAPLEALSLQPHQAIHVGDNLVDDIAGAHSVGMYTVWVNLDETTTDGDVTPHAVATHLSELPDIVRTLSAR